MNAQPQLMPIPFTQFIMPRGREAIVHIERPANVAAIAQKIIAMGLRFECEMLSDFQTISLTISHPKDGDVEIEVVPNGPQVPVAVDRMIERFAKSKRFAKAEGR